MKKKNNIKELNNKPSYDELLTIVYQLVKENREIKNNIEIIKSELSNQKSLEKKNIKLNSITWLNKKIHPKINMTYWKELFIENINDDIITLISEKKIHTIITNSICEFYEKQKKYENPIVSFVNSIDLYIYDISNENNENNFNRWKKIDSNYFHNFIVKIVYKYIEVTNSWYKKNKINIDNYDKYGLLYLKAISSLYNSDFKNISFSNKVKKNFIQKIKLPYEEDEGVYLT